jgi:hypothetical protein
MKKYARISSATGNPPWAFDRGGFGEMVVRRRIERRYGHRDRC